MFCYRENIEKDIELERRKAENPDLMEDDVDEVPCITRYSYCMYKYCTACSVSWHAKATSRAACTAPGYLFPFVLCHGAEWSVITFFKWCQVCCFNMQGTL